MRVTIGEHTRTVREWVMELLPLLLQNEDPSSPLTDPQLVKYCAANGIRTGPGTVKVVRRLLGIPNSYARKSNDDASTTLSIDITEENDNDN